MIAASEEKRVIWTKVWEAPVRIVHWTIFVSVAVLCATGYLIGNPPFSAPGEVTGIPTLGLIRFLHFMAGYVLLAAFIVRLYWGFMGNRFARWTTMIPWNLQKWRTIFLELRDLFLPWRSLRAYIGHAPLGNVTYFLVYIGIFFALLTGFIMYSAHHYTFFWKGLGSLGLALFGYNLNWVRFLHHLLLWLSLLFLVFHLYLVIYSLVASKTTEVDTMISGYKYVLEEELAEEEKEETIPKEG